MKSSSVRLIEPAFAYVYEAANDNEPRSHSAPITARAKAGRLFSSAEENILAVRTINRMDALLAAAESDQTYTTTEFGSISSDVEDCDDWALGPAIVEVAGRSAERVIEDFHNGSVAYHDQKEPSDYPPLYIHGRFKFNVDGIIIGYRLNREKREDDRDIWVSKSSPKFPDNVATPRDRATTDHRGIQPGKTSSVEIVTPANDNYDSRSCITWIKARMAPEHYEAVYDTTAGLGFNEIGVAAGFSGKQADAVGKDRVICGLRQAARLLAEWDDAS
ncbi:hypothetical protein [Rhizobium lusitanum]|uniref:hypothetical protein n=1 Tax=Rhizobium lusitanum TaxID=293958 RepID=UPI00195AB003|nr:hypothetical protein [Rhizobium lusitanum]MBM7045228.1 hypothetical protein [Rhizobium lusitanum]